MSICVHLWFSSARIQLRAAGLPKTGFAPEAGWPPAVPEGQNASPGGPRPSNPSIESSEEPGFVPSSDEALPRIKFTTDSHCQPKAPEKNDNLIDTCTTRAIPAANCA